MTPTCPLNDCPKEWNSDAHSLWTQGKRKEAIAAVAKQWQELGEKTSPALSLQLAYYFFLMREYTGGVHVLIRQAARTPEHVETLQNLAVCFSRIGEHSKAVATARRVLELDTKNVLMLDLLAKTLAASNNTAHHKEAAQAGTRALNLKNSATQFSVAKWKLPSGHPQSVAAKNYKHNVISFSLWGDNIRYLRGAVRNVLAAKEVYPNWRLRFHLDTTVPKGCPELLRKLGAELVHEPDGQPLRQKLAWRFKVANDKSVGYFLVRDADAVVSKREAQAVRQWQESDKWFHVIRDWWTHTDLMLAGLWGGVAGVLPPMAQLLKSYSPKHMETANEDQWFLRDRIWPLIRSSCHVNDRFYSMPGSAPMPGAPPVGNKHVGQNEFAVALDEQAEILADLIKEHPWLSAKE